MALLWRRAQAYRMLDKAADERQALEEALELAPQGGQAWEIRARLAELAPP